MAPEVFRIGKLPPRATFRHYPDAALAQEGARERSGWFLSLDGEWQFRLEKRPEDAAAFLDEEQRARSGMAGASAGAADGWGAMPVPGSWQMHRTDDLPHYTNVPMPFPEAPPEVPAANPTGIYRRTLAIPKEWEGRRVVLHFGGADNTLLVYWDGKPVGLSKDSRTPAEFDVTGLVRAGGTHELTAVVIKWSDASFVEDQDHWWLSGLHREVFLEAMPALHLADLEVRAGLAEDGKTGTLEVLAWTGITGGAAREGAVVEVSLWRGGKPVWKAPLQGEVGARRSGQHARVYGQASVRATVKGVRRWTAEDPVLYRVVVVVRGGDGACDATAVDAGFRRVEVRGGNLLVNGKAVLIAGMNRHDHHDRLGKAVPREALEMDARRMKQFNVNAVRTSHYPNDPYWLELCDRYGLYVIDEANIEAHAFVHEVCRDARYRGAFLDRVANMVARDRNHPCVIAWSLGNESGYGPNHDAAAGWVRAADPSRVLHYEGAISRWLGEGWEGGRRATDIVCPMYAGIAEIEAYAKDKRADRPLILCEFSHAMGNSNGSLADYFAAFERHRLLQGGFVWEWIDHGIVRRDEAGRKWWVYGGDFGDEPNDANFVCDGMVWPDRRPHPGLYEFKHLAQPVRVRAGSRPGRVTVVNRRRFSGLEDLKGHWEMKAGDRVLRRGAMPALKLGPGESREIALPLKAARGEPGEEVFLDFTWVTVKAAEWAPAGHLVAWDQVALPAARKRRVQRKAVAAAEGEPWAVENGRKMVTAVRGGTRAVFDLEVGRMVSFAVDGAEALVAGPTLNAWRAPTDNDGIRLWQGQENKPLGRWRNLKLDRMQLRLRSARMLEGRGGVAGVELEHEASGREVWGDLRHRHRYVWLPDGRLRVENEFWVAKELADLPRLGVRMVLGPGWENLRWFGRGPWENYPDRKASALVDVFRSTVRDQYVPYILPQEHGLKCDVRWMELGREAGGVVRFTGTPMFQFSASHLAAEDLEEARHTCDLKPRAATILCVDAAHRGLGTASCGPDTLERYRIPAGRHKLVFTIGDGTPGANGG